MPMNVRTLCLAILCEGDASGYEIRKLSMDETCKFSHFIDVSYGAVYPALNKLEEEGKISGRLETQEGKPSKRVYSITDLGRKELVSSLSDVPEPDKFKSEFLLVAMHADLLPHSVIMAALNERIAYLQHKIEAIESCCFLDTNSKGAEFVFNYGLLMNKTSLKYLLEHRDKLEQAAKKSPSVAAE